MGVGLGPPSWGDPPWASPLTEDILTLYSRHASKWGGHLLVVAFLLLALLKVLLVVALLFL